MKNRIVTNEDMRNIVFNCCMEFKAKYDFCQDYKKASGEIVRGGKPSHLILQEAYVAGWSKALELFVLKKKGVEIEEVEIDEQ